MHYISLGKSLGPLLSLLLVSIVTLILKLRSFRFGGSFRVDQSRELGGNLWYRVLARVRLCKFVRHMLSMYHEGVSIRCKE